MNGAVQLRLDEAFFSASVAPPIGTPSPDPVPARPHPIPYQGSKRLLAPRILAVVAGRRYRRLIEPFAGSAAITIAAAGQNLADSYSISDSLASLIAIWRMVLDTPDDLAAAYECVWRAQSDHPGHYNTVRDEYNLRHDPAALLYLLARCVKNAPRWNRQGAFNQGPDNRRRGMHPSKMRLELLGAHALLARRTSARTMDFQEALAEATPEDLVYMDPPYAGTTEGPHRRYHQGLPRWRLIEALDDLNRRGISFLLSYDGRCGPRTYGPPLPSELGMRHIELAAGRSSQATLNGRAEQTVESLYASRGLL